LTDDVLDEYLMTDRVKPSTHPPTAAAAVAAAADVTSGTRDITSQ